MAIDYNTASDIVAKMSDDDKAFLYKARDGMALDGIDEAFFERFRNAGLVRTAPFENVRAAHALMGVLTTEDGDKLIQTLEQNQEVGARDQLTVNDSGEIEKTTKLVADDTRDDKDVPTSPAKSEASYEANKTDGPTKGAFADYGQDDTVRKGNDVAAGRNRMDGVDMPADKPVLPVEAPKPADKDKGKKADGSDQANDGSKDA